MKNRLEFLTISLVEAETVFGTIAAILITTVIFIYFCSGRHKIVVVVVFKKIYRIQAVVK